MKLYIEQNDELRKTLDDVYVGDTSLQIEELAKKLNLFYSCDDMGDCYLSFDEDCCTFIEFEVEEA